MWGRAQIYLADLYALLSDLDWAVQVEVVQVPLDIRVLLLLLLFAHMLSIPVLRGL
jgi:hypothetical protein